MPKGYTWGVYGTSKAKSVVDSTNNFPKTFLDVGREGTLVHESSNLGGRRNAARNGGKEKSSDEMY